MKNFIFELILSLSKLEDTRESYSYTNYYIKTHKHEKKVIKKKDEKFEKK